MEGEGPDPYQEMVMDRESIMMGVGMHRVISLGAGAEEEISVSEVVEAEVTIMVLMLLINMMEDIIKKHPHAARKR